MATTPHYSSNAEEPVCWYVLRTSKQKSTKDALMNKECVEDVYLPVRHQTDRDSHKVTENLLFSSYLFVRSQLSPLREAINPMANVQLSLDAHRDYYHPMVVPDEDMKTFMLSCEHYTDIEIIINPEQVAKLNDKARFLSGPFAGYEGEIRKIKKDLKLVIKVGDMELAIGNIQKQDIEIIHNYTAYSTLGASIAVSVDYFKEILLGHEVVKRYKRGGDIIAMHEATRLRGNIANLHNAPVILQELIAHFPTSGNKSDWEKAFRPKNEAEKQDEGKKQIDAIALNFIQSLTDGDFKLFNTLYSTIKVADIQDIKAIIPGTILRPFLTPSKGVLFTADAINIKGIEERIIETECLEDFDGLCHTYYAHVAVERNDDGTATLYTNWPNFYDGYKNLDETSKTALLEKCNRYHADLFRQILTDTESSKTADSEPSAQFLTSSQLGINGLGIKLPANADIDSEVAKLVNQGVKLCHELNANNHFRTWHKLVANVWLRWINKGCI